MPVTLPVEDKAPNLQIISAAACACFRSMIIVSRIKLSEELALTFDQQNYQAMLCLCFLHAYLKGNHCMGISILYTVHSNWCTQHSNHSELRDTVLAFKESFKMPLEKLDYHRGNVLSIYFVVGPQLML